MESRGRQRERGGSPCNHNKYRKDRSKSRLEKIDCWNYGKRGNLNKDYRAPKKKGDRQKDTIHEENVAGDVLQDASILALDNNSD